MALPLNIFEQRYLDLIKDTIKKDKLMGMVQSKKMNSGLSIVISHITKNQKILGMKKGERESC